MNRLLAPALLLALPMPAWADPPQLSIPAEVKAQPGAWVVVSPDTTAKSVAYIALDGLSAFPSSELKDPRKLVVNAPTPPAGTQLRFRFVAVGTLNDEQAVQPFVIVVGDGSPPPPPDPIDPPGPVDAALLTSLQAAYTADAGADKATSLKFLKAAYKGMAANPRAGLATNADVFAWMKSVVEAPGVGLTDTQLTALRRAIAARLLAAFGGVPTAPMDAAKFKAELTTIGNALARVH